MTAIFIGRFQPFHKGHLKAIKWILKREKRILIVIGSAKNSPTENNPFSFKERKEMVERTLLAENIKNFKIFGVADSPNDILWAKNIFKITKLKPKDVVVFTQNPWTKRCLKKIGVKIKSHPMFFNELSATEIREKIRENLKWKNLVPQTVLDFLNKINGEKKLKNNVH